MKPFVAQEFIEEAKKNSAWKMAFATAKHEQIVFMCVTPSTSEKNEIGMEVHPFDQVILIVDGSGKTVLNGKETDFKAGDLIFIPEGTQHSVINQGKELKLISFYSATDIPAGTVYKKQSDEKAQGET